MACVLAPAPSDAAPAPPPADPNGAASNPGRVKEPARLDRPTPEPFDRDKLMRELARLQAELAQLQGDSTPHPIRI